MSKYILSQLSEALRKQNKDHIKEIVLRLRGIIRFPIQVITGGYRHLVKPDGTSTAYLLAQPRLKTRKLIIICDDVLS